MTEVCYSQGQQRSAEGVTAPSADFQRLQGSKVLARMLGARYALCAYGMTNFCVNWSSFGPAWAIREWCAFQCTFMVLFLQLVLVMAAPVLSITAGVGFLCVRKFAQMTFGDMFLTVRSGLSVAVQQAGPGLASQVWATRAPQLRVAQQQ